MMKFIHKKNAISGSRTSGSFFIVLRTILVVLISVMVLGSCRWYFTADIAGYVKDSDSESGVNGVVIRIYLSEPATADADGFIVETATATSSGNAGYFSHRVIWQNATPAFGEEGDSNSLWLGISHEDYLSAVVQVRGILSGTLNLVPDIQIDRAGFSVPLVQGQVVDPSGDGINGVQIVLDIPTTDDEQDYVTVTTQIDDVDGMYEFTDVSWRDDASAGTGSDTEDVYIKLDDEDYSYYGTYGDLTVTLSSDVEIFVDQELHAASDEFTVSRVWGRVLDVAGEPLNGVRIVLDLASTTGTDEAEDYVTTSATIDGEEGIYEFNDVTWVDEAALGSATDTEPVTIIVDDNDYETSTTFTPTLESGQDTEAGDFTVTRIDATEFSTRVTGRCISRIGTAPDTQDLPERGVEVSLSWTDDDGAHTLYDQTDVNGEYSFLVQWTDATPGDFLDGSADSTIPVGEDGLIVEIVFATPFNGVSFTGTTAGTYELPTGATDDDRLIKSWLDPNYVPDAVN